MRDEEMMDITPETNLLRSLRGERLDYSILIGEAIDNSFDAESSTVQITIDEEFISFKDDGAGITKDKIAALFSLGGHVASSHTRLGRFGIGIKNQAVNAGDVFQVTSTSRDGKVSATADWDKVLRGRSWQIPKPMWMPSIVGAATGTEITISKLRAPPPASLAKIKQSIAERFYPAIDDGKKIKVNGETIALLSEPPLTDIIDVNVALSNGRSCRIRGGILIAPNHLNSVHIGYHHRIIKPGCALGCGEYAGIKRLFVRVSIFGPWRLAKYKDDLTDAIEEAELDEAIFQTIRPLLEKVSSQAFDAKTDELKKRVNEMLPEALAASRPQKSEPKGRSAAKGGKSGNEIKPDASVLDANGPTRTRTARDRLMITFDGSVPEDGIGSYVSGKPHRVNLSRDHRQIALVVALKDQEAAAEILMTYAIMIFQQGRGDGELAFKSFGVAVSDLLAIQDEATAARERS